jgi:hypothetical protein
MSTRLFGTSIEVDAKTIAQIMKIIREHLPFESFDSLNDAFDYYRDNREKSLKIINPLISP